MKTLNFELKKLCRSHKEGSFATQADRHEMLQQVAGELEKLGFRNLRAAGLKPKHIQALVKAWTDRGLSPGRIKNLMATIRWWANKVQLSGVIAASNDAYGIQKRTYVTNTPKISIVTESAKEGIRDPYVRAAIELQEAFGLRREEAIKFMPSYADKGDRIMLKSSWTKGGKAREILIRNEVQRQALRNAHAVAKQGALIPPTLRYIDQRRRYEASVASVGLSKLHGLRHAYAQARYLDITGRLAPACGGKTSTELTHEEKQEDLLARIQISKELGHEREQVTAIYLGR